jgi:hypothetical protein
MSSRQKIRVVRNASVAPLIISLERARSAAVSAPSTHKKKARDEDDDAARSRNEWLPRECLAATLAGLGFMALEVPLALYYAARGRRRAKKRRTSPRQLAFEFLD